MSLVNNPQVSRRAAVVIQDMGIDLRFRFVEALQNAERVSDLPSIFQDYLANGYKTDKVSMPDDDIWDKLEFEWVEE